MTIPTFMALVTCILAFLAFLVEFRCVQILGKTDYRWIKLAYTVICLYWSFIYFGIAIDEPHDTVIFGQSLIRPGIMVTVGIILTGGIYRLRSLGGTPAFLIKFILWINILTKKVTDYVDSRKLRRQ